MVTRYGFSSLGPVALETDAPEVFLGRDWIRSEAPYSGKTGRMIDAQIRLLACQALEEALAILRPRRELMDELVERLIAEETIEGASFRAAVTEWESSHPALALPSGKADVEAAKVGV
jgi:cell division protease FtsH